MRLSIDSHAWSRGFHDGEAGRPLHSCPYAVGTTERWSWSSGYIEGNAARRGYSAHRPIELRSKKDAPAAEPYAGPLRVPAPVSAAGRVRMEGVKIARRRGVKVRRRLTFQVHMATVNPPPHLYQPLLTPTLIAMGFHSEPVCDSVARAGN